MSQIRITFTIDIPDGARVSTPDVDYVPVEPAGLLVPLDQYDADVIVRPVAVSAPGCPVHGAMTRFPAGVSNKPGHKPYNASWRCAISGCETAPIWDRDR